MLISYCDSRFNLGEISVETCLRYDEKFCFMKVAIYSSKFIILQSLLKISSISCPLFLCVYHFVSSKIIMHVCAGACGSQSHSIILELELQVVMSHQTWVLGSKLMEYGALYKDPLLPPKGLSCLFCRSPASYKSRSASFFEWHETLSTCSLSLQSIISTLYYLISLQNTAWKRLKELNESPSPKYPMMTEKTLNEKPLLHHQKK